MSHYKTLMALLTAVLLLPAAALAQEAAENAEGAEGTEGAETSQEEKRQELVRKYQNTVQELQQIRDEAVTENPSLDEQSRAYEEQVEQAVNDSGYDLDAGREKLQEMGGRFQDEELSQEDRQKLAAKFQAERQKMEQARQQAMQQEEILAAGQKLQKDIVTAMKEQDSQTEALMQRLRDLRAKLQALEAGNGNAAPASEDS